MDILRVYLDPEAEDTAAQVFEHLSRMTGQNVGNKCAASADQNGEQCLKKENNNEQIYSADTICNAFSTIFRASHELVRIVLQSNAFHTVAVTSVHLPKIPGSSFAYVEYPNLRVACR